MRPLVITKGLFGSEQRFIDIAQFQQGLDPIDDIVDLGADLLGFEKMPFGLF